MQETQSVVPLILFMIPAVAAIMTAFFGKKRGFSREGISAIGVIVTLLLSVYFVYVTLLKGSSGTFYSALYKNVFVDAFSAMMALLINVLLFLILLYSFTYMKSLVESGKIRDENLRLYYSLVMAFDATMMLTVISNNLIMLYIAVEASTLATAILVCFFRDRRGLEAAFKYIVLIVVGIAFALLGCVLVYSAAVPHLTGREAVLLSEIGKVASIIPKNVALLAVACFIIGFSAKGGLLPFHPWLPDAHAEAPTPISALLSGLIIKIGAYAFARTVTIFAPHYEAIILYMTGVACISMFVGILIAFAQDDIKRLLAFSSVSQISYIFAALGLGSYVGIYAGVFHIVNHAMLKTLLFFAAGAIMYATNTRKISELGGLSRKMPITSVCFFTGALGVSGMPLFSGFHSKFGIFVAMAQQGLWWAVAIAVGTGLLTLAVFTWTGYRIFWGPTVAATAESKEIPFAMWLPMILLVGLIILVGIYPQILYPILNSTTQSILHISKG